jgi:hypothetical protein
MFFSDMAAPAAAQDANWPGAKPSTSASGGILIYINIRRGFQHPGWIIEFNIRDLESKSEFI